MWAGIIKTLLDVAKSSLDLVLYNKMMNNANEIEKLEIKLDKEYRKPLDAQDDLLIERLEGELEIAKDALERQLQLGVSGAKAN